MGVDQSKDLLIYQNKTNFLTISVDQEFYYPGQQIKGAIWVKTTESFETYGLETKFQLQENWYFKSGKHDYRDENIQNLSERSVDIENSLQLNNGKHELPVGEYSFPFTLDLPKYLQPSFEYPLTFKHGYLRYVLYARLLSNKGETNHISNIYYIIIRTRPAVLCTPLQFSSCQNVHSWYFFEKGVTILTASYPRNNYTFGNEIDLTINVDNTRGKIKVTQIFAEIVRKVTFSSVDARDRKSYECSLDEKTIVVSCIPGDISTEKTSLTLCESKNEAKYYNNVDNPNRHLMVDQMYVIFFQPSLDSVLIKCEYIIKVTLGFESVVFGDSKPKVELPVSVTHQLIEDYHKENEIKEMEEKGKIEDTKPVESAFYDINAI